MVFAEVATRVEKYISKLQNQSQALRSSGGGGGGGGGGGWLANGCMYSRGFYSKLPNIYHRHGSAAVRLSHSAETPYLMVLCGPDTRTTPRHSRLTKVYRDVPGPAARHVVRA
eukprot:SAG11_NODE_2199_length_3697_cov_2.182324_4_plen_113_part_00